MTCPEQCVLLTKSQTWYTFPSLLEQRIFSVLGPMHAKPHVASCHPVPLSSPVRDGFSTFLVFQDRGTFGK